MDKLSDYPLMPISSPSETKSRIEAFKEHFQRFAVLKIEFDEYAQLASQSGFATAEAAIQIVLASLEKSFPGSKSVYRVGVSTIEALISLKQREDRDACLNMIRKTLSMKVGIQNVRSSIVLYPDDSSDASALLTRLDGLMPSARDVRDNKDKQVDFGLEIEEGRVFVHYQPIYRANGDVRSMECSVRWKTPHGVLSPSEFLDSLLAQGHGAALTKMLLSSAAGAFGRFEKASLQCKLLSINIDPLMLLDKHVVAAFKDFAKIDDASRIELEMPDVDIVFTNKELFAVIEGLVQIGYKLVIEGFGSRYVWLNHLEWVSALKLDRDITRKIVIADGAPGLIKGNMMLTLLKSILSAAGEQSGVDVIADGVERQSEYDTLEKYGVKAMQGHLLAKPAALDAAIEGVAFMAAIKAQDVAKQPDKMQ